MDPRKWLFDTRVVRRNLDRGVLTWKAYKEHLKAMPDLDGEFEVIDFEREEEEAAEGEEGAAEGEEATEAEAEQSDG